MYSDVGINDNEFPPDPGDQLLVRHDLSRILHQDHQKVERPTTDLYGHTVFQQQAPRWVQLERPKKEHAFIGWSGGVHGPNTLPGVNGGGMEGVPAGSPAGTSMAVPEKKVATAAPEGTAAATTQGARPKRRRTKKPPGVNPSVGTGGVDGQGQD